MNRILAVLAGLAFVVISENSSAYLDFDSNPIACGPIAATPPSSSPTPLDCTQTHATTNGYYISNVSWNAILLPPPPGGKDPPRK